MSRSKPGRLHISITREGWYYLFVLLFIVGGAVLREVNLLVMLSGLMIGPLVLNWRLAVLSMRRLQLTRHRPGRATVGTPLRVQMSVSCGRRHVTTWMLSITDTIQRVGSGREGRAKSEVIIPSLPARAARQAAYRLLLQERGEYRLGPARLFTRFPFGLIGAWRQYPEQKALIAWPRLGKLTPHWKHLLSGERTGAKASRSRRGTDGDFYSLRHYVPGDSTRMLHWRSTARVGSPVVKQCQQLERPEVALVLDLWTNSQASPQQRQLVERAISLTATAVTDLCRESGNRLTLTLPGSPPRSFQGPPNRQFAEQLLDELAVLKGEPVDVEPALLLSRQYAPAAVLIVVSTRASQYEQIRHSVSSNEEGWIDRAHWVDVGDELTSQLFEGEL